MALTIVSDDVVGQFSTTVSKSISVQAGDLLVVAHHSEGELADMLTPTPGSWTLQQSGGLSSGRAKGKLWTQIQGSTTTITLRCRNNQSRLHGFAYWLLRDVHGTTPVFDTDLFSEASDDDFNLPVLTAPPLPSFALFSILAVGSRSHDVHDSAVIEDGRYSFFGYGSIDAYRRFQQSSGLLPTINVDASGDADHVVLACMVQGVAGLAAEPLALEEVETLPAVDPAHVVDPDRLDEVETLSGITLLKGHSVEVFDEIEDLPAVGVIQNGNRIIWANQMVEVETLGEVQVHKTRKIPAARDADRGFTKEFRVIAQRWTGEILDLDVQMTGLQVTEAILGPGSITGTITPEQAQYMGDDGYPIFEQWGTLLTAEYRETGEVLCSCILTEITTRDEDLVLVADGFSSYPDGLPHLGEYSQIQVDACDAYRELWAETQRWPGRTIGMGVTVSNQLSGVLLGEPAYQEPVLDENGQQRRNEDGTLQFREVEAKPYELSKKALTDMGQEALKLAKGVPFDYEERAWWNEDSTDFYRHIELGIPRFGRYRPELSFVLGENIEEYPDLVEDPTAFADFGVAVGKGEGDKGLYTTHSVRNENRLSRVHTLTDKTVGDSSQLQRLLEDDLRSMRQPREIRRIVVDRWHSHAPDGSYRKGDDILVQGDFSWWGRIAIKHRIVSITRTAGEDTVELELRRSDSFRFRRDPGLV